MDFEETRTTRVKRFIKEAFRVLRITKKPSKEEFQSTVKVTGIGLLLIGAIGYVIFVLKQILF